MSAAAKEIIEAALKLARQYWVESGRPEKQEIISLAPGYHGNTLLALSASARPHYATYFREWIVDVHRVPAPVAYRCACRGDDASCAVCSGVARGSGTPVRSTRSRRGSWWCCGGARPALPPT